ncbi:hypothetical protein [Yoonia sp.]|uniref:hypothetical protein n=1 Tax=Yoonia sp. TaxID=2212373 RepID=UPI003F6B1BF5
MKDRWQKSLETAVAACDTPMPWERGAARQSMIARRQSAREEASSDTRQKSRLA